MKTNSIYTITFDTDETIVAATLSRRHEVVMLMSSGNVIRYHLADEDGEHLFSVKSNFEYADGGFDIEAKSSIYTLDELVVVVNDFKRHGFVHHPGKYQRLHLWREDYHASISTYPIALYKNVEGVPHLIFGQAWNHVQIMNLDTRQILTADKSLIEEGAEESHLEFYKVHSEENKLPWPRPYDYFFGKLLMSPDRQKFLSAGWVWGSFDSYRVYDTAKFISSNRIAHVNIDSWEHENRATCWVDDDTVAVLVDPFMEGEDDALEGASIEIHLYKINGPQVEISRRIRVEGEIILKSDMYFNPAIDAFVFVSDNGELSVILANGQQAYREESMKASGYDPETGCFLVVDNKTISIYELTA